MKGLFKKLSALLFPPRCMFCGRIIDDGFFCASCRSDLPECGEVKGGGEFFSGCAASFYYTGNVRRAVLAMKFYGKRGYAAGFGEFLAQTVTEHLDGKYDVITWVPISGKRLRKRGYDQARLIAEETAKILAVPVCRTLLKRRDTPAQSSLKGRERRAANVSGAYEAANAGSFRGKRILLIDDVCTTGATLSECSRVLLMAGAEDVVCAAAAAAKKR
ncbi:MAG: ComF family protein [Oscillospiraceae bacterium]